MGLMGYGVVRQEGDALTALDYGAISTEAGLPLATRLRDLYGQLNRKFSEHRPDVVSVEKFFFGQSKTTAEMVYHARGVILLAAANAGLVPYEPKPSEVKLAVCGYGAADKAQVQGMVCHMLGLDRVPRPDDAADALAAAITGLSLAAYDSHSRRGFDA
jgi:crossover junction endodeoxyribonuclease RuvC